MEFQGKVIQFLGETSGVSSRNGNPWKKKEWVVETFGQYPRKVKIQCFGERADNINLEPGRDYTLSVDLESREYNGRWYTDVSVFRATEYTGQQTFGSPAPQSFGNGYPQSPAGGQPSSFGGAPFGEPTSFTAQEPADSDEDLPF